MGRAVQDFDTLRGVVGAGSRGEGGGRRELRVVAEQSIDGYGVAAADIDVPIGDRGGSEFDGIRGRVAAVCGLRAVVELSGKVGSVVSMQNCGMETVAEVIQGPDDAICRAVGGDTRSGA